MLLLDCFAVHAIFLPHEAAPVKAFPYLILECSGDTTRESWPFSVLWAKALFTHMPTNSTMTWPPNAQRDIRFFVP